MKKQKEIKAWAIVDGNVIIDDFGDFGRTLTIFVRKKDGKKYLEELGMEDEWKVVPCKITLLLK